MTVTTHLNRLYRRSELPAFVGLRRTKIAELIEAGEFPKPITLTPGGRAVAWVEADILRWQQSRIAARDAGEK